MTATETLPTPTIERIRHELRRREAEPILDQLEIYLATLAGRVLPKSALATAVAMLE